MASPLQWPFLSNVGHVRKGFHMKLMDIPFEITDWSSVEPTVHIGESGYALWRTRQLGDIRVRMVEYSPGYLADHWCVKGHILLCLEGELRTELADGRTFLLTPGVSYQVADDAEPHRSQTSKGARLFIVD
jgi:quercetin dioxygenase-like cupin family protein